MYFKRFQQGDKVNYCGEKLASELGGKLGYVVGRVEGTKQGVVVDFGNGAYIMDEVAHLAKFQGRESPQRFDADKGNPAEKADKKVGNTEVQSRKGIGRTKKFSHKD